MNPNSFIYSFVYHWFHFLFHWIRNFITVWPPLEVSKWRLFKQHERKAEILISFTIWLFIQIRQCHWNKLAQHCRSFCMRLRKKKQRKWLLIGLSIYYLFQGCHINSYIVVHMYTRIHFVELSTLNNKFFQNE